MERRQAARLDIACSAARAVQRVLTADGDVGTELWVDALDALEVHLDEDSTGDTSRFRNIAA